jgi:hypothetical protein
MKTFGQGQARPIAVAGTTLRQSKRKMTVTSSTPGTRPIAQAVVVGGLDDAMLTGRAGVSEFPIGGPDGRGGMASGSNPYDLLRAVLEVPGDGGRSSMMSNRAEAIMRLPFRPDRRTMGVGGAAHPSSEIRRSSTYNGRARCPRRNPLSAPHGLPMAATFQRFSALRASLISRGRIAIAWR